MGDCSKCVPARCCLYVTVPHETPRNERDFSDLLWRIAHPGVSIYVEEGKWYTSFDTRCKFLQNDNRCGIYETRPKVCREYSDNWCAYDAEYGFDMEFKSYAELKEYVDIRLSPGGAKKVKKLKDRWKPKSWVPPHKQPRTAPQVVWEKFGSAK